MDGLMLEGIERKEEEGEVVEDIGEGRGLGWGWEEVVEGDN